MKLLIPIFMNILLVVAVYLAERHTKIQNPSVHDKTACHRSFVWSGVLRCLQLRRGAPWDRR